MTQLTRYVLPIFLTLALRVACADVVIAETIQNPEGLMYSGIIANVRISQLNINGTDVHRVFEIDTTGEFNTMSGGFFALTSDPFLGISDAAFVRTLVDIGSSDTAFLLGNPTAVTVGATDTSTTLRVDAATYATPFAAGTLELAAMTFAGIGSFSVRGSDQFPDRMIFLNASGDIVGTIQGTVSAVPEPSSLALICIPILFFCLRRRVTT